MDYQIISAKLTAFKPAHIDIIVRGTLDGKIIQEEFFDLNSYRDFLQYSLLIDCEENPDFAKALAFLKVLGFVDAPANAAIPAETQLAIKKRLLKETDLSIELSMYSDMFDAVKPTGETLKKYEMTTRGMLKKALPDLVIEGPLLHGFQIC